MPHTILAGLINGVIRRHDLAFSHLLGGTQVLLGVLLVLGLWVTPVALGLFLLNVTFALTLGMVSPHDLALNVTMGLGNLLLALTGGGVPYGFDGWLTRRRARARFWH